MIWLQFLLLLVVIGFAGVKLSVYGDAIADKSGLGSTWVGLVLLAAVTSLPELITGISSVTVADTPDIAVGDVLGSCVFNLLIIVALDLFYRRESVYTAASHGHVVGAGFGIILIAFSGFSLVWSAVATVPAIFHVGIYSPLILALYVIALHTTFNYERQVMAEFIDAEPDDYPHITLKQAIIRYVIAALFVVAAGAWLPFVGKAVAVEMGWHESFVGTLFVAFVTSVPELVVTFAAMKIGAINMAIGNLVGSNIFNIMILAVDDLFFLKGPLLAHVSPSHASTALAAVIMSGVAVVALLYSPRTRVLNTVSWASILLVGVYLLNSFVLFSFE
jgi:cation:H+ antiporter